MCKLCFVGIDSDGTIFDTMAAKHKQSFIPAALKIWYLEEIKDVFEVYEMFVNLQSEARGIDRFSGLYLLFQYLEEYVERKKITVRLPQYKELKRFLDAGLPLSNESLADFLENHQSAFLEETLAWSKMADQMFLKASETIAPFPMVPEVLKTISQKCDIAIVSSASQKGLEMDLDKYGLTPYLKKIMGQEYGSKSSQLAKCNLGQYENCIMIGDALGDRKAADANQISFYPILDGKEQISWLTFITEVYPLFLSGQFTGDYENTYLEVFAKSLPDIRCIRDLL